QARFGVLLGVFRHEENIADLNQRACAVFHAQREIATLRRDVAELRSALATERDAVIAIRAAAVDARRVADDAARMAGELTEPVARGVLANGVLEKTGWLVNTPQGRYGDVTR